MLAERIESLLGIPPAQQRRTALLFCYAFGMSGAYVSARAGADAVFLARAGIERLPAMILVSATAVTLIAAVYARAIRSVPLRIVILLFHLLLAAATALLAALLPYSSQTVAIPAGLYLLAELRGALGSIQFSTLLNELFHSSAPARVTGIASAGSTLAGVAFGAVTGLLAGRVGMSSLLVIVPLLDVLAGVVAMNCRRAGSHSLEDDVLTASQTNDRRNRPVSWRQTLSHPLARYLAVLVALKTMTVVLLEFEWKQVAVEELASEDALASFFGEFYAVVFLLTGVVQLVGTSRVLTGLGLRAALASFPLCVGSVLLAVVVPGTPTLAFWGLTVARGSDVLRRGLTDPALNVLYWPLEPAFRRQVIAFTGGWVKPLVEAASAGLLIPLAAHLSLPEMAAVIAGLCVVWLIVIYRGRFTSRRRGSRHD